MSLLRFSPLSENILAAVTGGSYVAIWELNLHEQGVSKVREREIKNVPYNLYNYIEIFARGKFLPISPPALSGKDFIMLFFCPVLKIG